MVKEKKFPKISVIIPAYYKRELDLDKFIDRLIAHIFKVAEDYEIIIVYDSKIQNLYNQVKQLSLRNEHIQPVPHNPKIGKEYAYLLEGYKKATSDYILFIDPYSYLKLDNIYILKELMQKEKADIVIGSKSHPYSKVTYSRLRKIASFIYYGLIKLLFNLKINDAQTGLKLYKKNLLNKVLPLIVTKKYAFDLEVLVCSAHHGFKIIEAPVEIKNSYRFEPLRLTDIYHILIDTLAIYYRLKILKFYDRLKPPLVTTPPVSILIAAKDYNENLKECVRRCKELDYPDFEIIVLPDKEIDIHDANIKVISTGKIFPPEKRDIGLKYSKGEIIAFLDDDAFPVENWIKNAVRYFSYDDIAAVGGPAVTPDDSPIRELASGAVYASRLVTWKNNYRYIPKVAMEVDDYPTCNLFIRKDVLDRIGGFGVKFWPGEDTIICHKITKDLGKKIYYDPDVLVYHRRRPLYLPHLRQVINYALHRGYFAKRYPATSLKLSYFFPSFFLIGLSFGWILAFYAAFLKIFYIAALAFYILWLLWIGVMSLNLKIAMYVVSGIFLTHLVYGWYFIKGLLVRRLPEEVS